jgi:hypothetical protein
MWVDDFRIWESESDPWQRLYVGLVFRHHLVRDLEHRKRSLIKALVYNLETRREKSDLRLLV